MTRVDSVAYFDALAGAMNQRAARFLALGPADMAVGIVMRRPGGDFGVTLTFEGTELTGLRELGDGEPSIVDFTLEGPLEAWQAMFDDITSHGRATGSLTINSLALLGTAIRCVGADPMGLDKFARFNQTLQEFFDGAAQLAVTATGD